MKPSRLIRTPALLCLGAVLTLSSSCFYGPRVAAPPPQPVYAEPAYTPPPWAPQYEYQERVRYYYLPDMQCYYDVYMHQYIYFDGYNWIHSPYAPAAYSSYDMNSGYVVVLNYGVSDPWLHHNTYVSNYPSGYYNNPSYSQNPSNNGGGSGPRRGYNENDKSTLYHGNPRNGGTQTPPANRNGNTPPAVPPANPPRVAPNETSPVRENNNPNRNTPLPVRENKPPVRETNPPVRENNPPPVRENRPPVQNNPEREIKNNNQQPRNTAPRPNNAKPAPPAKKTKEQEKPR